MDRKVLMQVHKWTHTSAHTHAHTSAHTQVPHARMHAHTLHHFGYHSNMILSKQKQSLLSFERMHWNFDTLATNILIVELKKVTTYFCTQ